jgi:hypothetical protein
MDEQPFKKIHRLRKSGNLKDAWDIGCQVVEENPNDEYLKGAFFWVCYDYLKEVQSSIKSRAEGGSGDYTPSSSELERINFLLDRIIQLNIPHSPGDYDEYRSLLLQFQINLECLPKLVLILIKYSNNLFTEEDKQPFVNEKGESPSLMLKFSRKVSKSWMANEEVRQINIDELCSLFALTRQEAKDKQHQIWLDYDEAKCLVLAKRFEQARGLALNTLRRKQTESWAWGALATTYRNEDLDAAIVLFSKALCCARDDVFVLPVLKGLAPLLAKKNYEGEASMCVKRAVNCYVENGWNIKSDLEKLVGQHWYNAEVDLELFPPFLEKQAATALDFLFGEREQRTAVVQNIHASGKGFHAYINRNQSLSVRLALYRSKRPLSVGDSICLTLSAEDQSVIAAEPCESESMDDVGYIEGKLDIKEQGFGVVEDAYVPKNLVRQDMNGCEVSGIKVHTLDKIKGKYGWQALTIDVLPLP